MGNVSIRFVGRHDVFWRIPHFLPLLVELLKPSEMSYLIQNRPVLSCFKIKSACVHKELVRRKTVTIIVQRWLSSSSVSNKRFKALWISICVDQKRLFICLFPFSLFNITTINHTLSHISFFKGDMVDSSGRSLANLSKMSQTERHSSIPTQK